MEEAIGLERLNDWGIFLDRGEANPFNKLDLFLGIDEVHAALPPRPLLEEPITPCSDKTPSCGVDLSEERE